MRRIAIALSALFLTHCGETQFQGSGARKGASSADGVPERDGTVTEEFPLTSRRGQIDMVWLIDNSGSMVNEADQVRKNFQSFLDSLRDRTDIKLALISKAESPGATGGLGGGLGGLGGLGYGGGYGSYGTTGVTLPPNLLSEGHVHIQTTVQSTNGLAIAAAASCPAEQTQQSGGGGFGYDTGLDTQMTICGRQLGSTGGSGSLNDLADLDFLEDPASVYAARGQLSSFFRPGAKRVYVFVTDDNARFVTDQNFLDLIGQASPDPANKPHVFAFRGIQNGAGCNITRRGSAYETIAAATGGSVFDICEPEWRPNFDALSQQVVEIAGSTFPLKGNTIAEVQKVEIDGRSVEPSRYRLQGNALSVDKEIIGTTGGTLRVTYRTR